MVCCIESAGRSFQVRLRAKPDWKHDRANNSPRNYTNQIEDGLNHWLITCSFRMRRFRVVYTPSINSPFILSFFSVFPEVLSWGYLKLISRRFREPPLDPESACFDQNIRTMTNMMKKKAAYDRQSFVASVMDFQADTFRKRQERPRGRFDKHENWKLKQSKLSSEERGIPFSKEYRNKRNKRNKIAVYSTRLFPS